MIMIRRNEEGLFEVSVRKESFNVGPAWQGSRTLRNALIEELKDNLGKFSDEFDPFIKEALEEIETSQ
jgi:radical SAM superfamily enzyme YgiQ (UPF0313 family)